MSSINRAPGRWFHYRSWLDAAWRWAAFPGDHRGSFLNSLDNPYFQAF